MKKVLLSTLIILALCATSFAKKTVVASGKTYTSFGDYKIELAEAQFTIDGKELKTYTISYTDSPLKVTVAIDEGKKCNRYIVMSDKLSVQYSCTDTHFGVEKLEKKYSKLGISTSDEDIKRSEYFNQKVLSREPASKLENTKLIAAYFPSLLK